MALDIPLGPGPYRSRCENCAGAEDSAHKNMLEKLKSNVSDVTTIAIVAFGVFLTVAATVVTVVLTKSEGFSCGAFLGTPALYVTFWALYQRFWLLKSVRSFGSR